MRETKLGQCNCEAATCVAGVLLDRENETIDETEHEPGGCPNEAVICIELFGMKESLCEDCYVCSVAAPGLEHVVLVDLRRRV